MEPWAVRPERLNCAAQEHQELPRADVVAVALSEYRDELRSVPKSASVALQASQPEDVGSAVTRAATADGVPRESGRDGSDLSG